MTPVPVVLAAGSLLDCPPTVVLDVAAATGFDAAGVRVSMDALPDPRVLAERCDDVGVALHDVEVFRIGSDPIDHAERLVEFAAESGAGRLLVVSDLVSESATADAVGTLCRLGRQYSVAIALEYMAWVTPSSSAGAIRIAEATGCLIVVDALHHCRLEEAPAAVVEVRNAGALGWFQICDGPSTAPSDLIAEARGGRMVPGEGELPLVELITAIGPSVAVSVEVQGLEHRYPDPVSRATMLLARTRSVLSRV